MCKKINKTCCLCEKPINGTAALHDKTNNVLCINCLLASLNSVITTIMEAAYEEKNAEEKNAKKA